MKLDVLTLLHSGRSVQLAPATAFSQVMVLAADSVAAVSRTVLTPTIEVPPTGVDFGFDWGPHLAGTDSLEVEPVAVEVVADDASDFAGYPLGELATKVSGTSELRVTVPPGRQIRALHLSGLKSEDVVFTSEQELAAAGRRLTASVRDPRGGWASPVVSVPPVGRHGQIPPTLVGASFAGAVLRLPDLAGDIRISIVDGDTPDTFSAHALSVGTVVGWAAPTPVDLTLTGPDGTVLWTFPGPMPPGTRQETDIAVAVAAAAEAQRSAGQAIAGALTLTSTYPSRVGFRVGAVRGRLIHTMPGTTTATLAGEPVPLPLAAPLPAAAPTTVVADVRVTYQGRRLAEISDPLPPAGSRQGVVVRQDPVLRLLAPLALRGERVSRIGLIGRCPQPTALLVRLIPAPAGAPQPAPGSGPAAQALGPPGTVTVEPSSDIAVIWVDLPEPVTIDQPVAIEVSAGSGSLYWVAEPDPLVRIVVLDPDPAGRPIVLGGGTLLTVDQPQLRTDRATLPAAAFTGTAPVLASALFCTVEITDAQLGYARGVR